MNTHRILTIALMLLAGVSYRSAAAADAAPLLKLSAVPFTQVEIQDSFWSPRRETNRLVSIPVNLAMLEKSGNLRNFDLAAARATHGFTSPVFMDSDVYKALEAASYSLATPADPELDKRQAGAMRVWLPSAPPLPKVGGLETQAQVTEFDEDSP
jgi:hypothetical protein